VFLIGVICVICGFKRHRLAELDQERRELKRMPNNVKHFAVHADDVERARAFYEKTFGWTFKPWGPPGFYLIQTGTDDDPGVQGALQGRREVVPGKPMFGFECSLGVDSIDDTIAAIEANGGKIVMPKFHIPTVGTLIFFEDTEGTVIGAMQYEVSHDTE
jgi:predicted enzyme related to lactoylglutathione lyase